MLLLSSMLLYLAHNMLARIDKLEAEVADLRVKHAVMDVVTKRLDVILERINERRRP